MEERLNWSDLHVFHVVAEMGSLTGAAQKLGVSASTVHRRVAALELALDSALFVRKASGYDLTDTGRALAPYAAQLEALVHELHREVVGRDAQLSGTVRITTTQLAADYILLPAMTAFRDSYPDITIELESMPQLVDILADDQSIALRFKRPEAGDLTIRRLGRLGCGLYASAELAEQTDVRALPHIGWTRQFRGIGLSRSLASRFAGRRPALALGTVQAHIAAAVSGFGVVNLPHFVAATIPDLVAIEPGVVTVELEAWMVVPRAIRNSARVAVVAEMIEDAVRGISV